MWALLWRSCLLKIFRDRPAIDQSQLAFDNNRAFDIEQNNKKRNLIAVISWFFIYCLPSQILQSKPFGSLAVNEVVISVKSLLTEITPLLATRMPKHFDLNPSSLMETFMNEIFNSGSQCLLCNFAQILV